MTEPHTLCIQNGEIILPDRVVRAGTVIARNGKIVNAGESRKTPRGAEEIDARRGYVCPGLIDVHVHGAGSNSLDPPHEDTLRGVANKLAMNGVLQFLPAMMADETLIEGLAELIDETGLGDRIPGIYPEGPFISDEKRGGIQEQFVKPVDARRLARLQKLARGKIRMMTFAPELGGAAVLPEAMRRLGILPCVGHTDATADEVRAVVGRSKVGVTHLFNAMTGLDHRAPGVAAWAINADNAWTELNPDGTHVAPELLRIVQRAKRPDRIVLISDAVISAGGPPGEYGYMERRVVANDRGVYYANDGTLIGSRALLNQGLGRYIDFTGAPVHEAVRAASLNPAEMLGLDKQKGSLEAGKDADIVVFTRDFTKAKAIIVDGVRRM